MIADWFHRLRQLWNRATQIPVAPLVALLTLLLVILWAELTWVVVAPVKVAVVAALLVKPLRTDPRLWLALAFLLAVGLAFSWHPKDNHQFLIVYICLGLFCAFHVGDEYTDADRDEVLRLSARWLVGAIMVAAVIWKLSTPDYLTGDFFHHQLLTREPLTSIATGLGLLPAELVADNQVVNQWLRVNHFSDAPAEAVSFRGTPAIELFATVLTWATLALEALVGLLWLWPRRLGADHHLVYHARHLALLIFIAGTYPIAPVIGFGWALAILGLANCAARPTSYRPLYVIALLVLLFLGFAYLEGAP